VARRARALVCLSLAAAWSGGASPPAPGARANLASFGRPLPASADAEPGWQYHGVEWDEAREIHEIRYRLAQPAAAVRLEYWVHNWPPKEGRGGWTTTDSPFRGEWRTAQVTVRNEEGVQVLRFRPLTTEENPNLKERPGYAPTFRQTLRLRLALRGAASPAVAQFEVYGTAVWNRRTVGVETGGEGKPAPAVTFSVYNGALLGKSQAGGRTLLDIAYLEHPPESADRTVLQVASPEWAFGVALDDLIRHREIYVRDLGVFFTAAAAEPLADFLASGKLRPGRDIHSRVGAAPEQSLEKARGEIPPLSHTGNNGRHPVRYVPLAFPGNREKLALEYNGNLFISKHGAKTFADERALLRWEGDKIRFRFGTGVQADFRERPSSARQYPRNAYQPVFVTEWNEGDLAYRAEAFGAPYAAPLEPWSNRGDEPAAAFVRLRVTNAGSRPATALTWFQISPEETLAWDGGWLRGEPGLRAWLKPSEGKLELRALPPSSLYAGQAAVWESSLAPGAAATLDVRIPFRTPVSRQEGRTLETVDADALLARLISFWDRTVRQGMRVRTPDIGLNRFWDGVLQHILASVYRDVPTGLFMAPCATYDYNMFLNETNMQVRLLDQRGLHSLAAKFLEPALARQGSKPFPGMFRKTDAIFHGVLIDAQHDYTHSGYNLNHGWTLWTLAEHYWFSRDEAWLRAKLPNLRRAAWWIVEERQATQRLQPDGGPVWEYGLLPAGQLEDNEEWQYWFAVNAYAHKGLKAAAEVIAEIDPAEGARLRDEARRYRDDIRAALRRSMAAAPVVPRGDGTWIPYLPSRTHLHGPDYGWIRNILYGAHALIDGEVIDPGETWAAWILQDLEDNRFMAPDSFPVAEQDWFSRGGITLQPNLVNTPLTYLARNEIPQALRAFYNTFAASYFEDVNIFAEWVPSFGRPGGPYYKTSDEAGFLTWLRMLLVREEGGTLQLARGAPRRWFRHGEVIEVEDAATFFGKISFRIASRVAERRLAADIRPAAGFRAQRLALTLRHPDKKRPRRIQAAGADVTSSWDPRTETLTIPAQPGAMQVEIDYED